MLDTSRAVARHEWRVLRRDWFSIAALVVMPLVFMTFLKPMYQLALVGEGFSTANGAEQAVPGMATMFCFVLVGTTGFVFLREHAWGTWDRLRATPSRSIEIILGKVFPLFLCAVTQLTAVWVAGGLLFDLTIRGSVIGIVLVGLALCTCVVSLGVMITAIAKNMSQVNAFQGVGTLVFAGIGGAITPVASLPGWAQAIAPLTPTYWAIRGFRNFVLVEAGVGTSLRPVLTLLLFAAAFTAVSLRRMRVSEAKIGWA